jgi:5'(3')-deoxyribonucleotidase
MRSLDLLFDLDGIIADLHAPWLEWINRHAGTALTKMDIHTYQMEQVAPKSVNVYDFLNTPGCYSTLPPVDGALEVLQQLHDDGHQVLIATMPVRRPESTTEKLEWCARMLPWLSRRAIYVGGDKSRIMADGFTDDDPANLRDFRKRQPQAFLATIAWPYNEGVDVEVRAQDCTRPHDAWQELYQHFTLFANEAPQEAEL